MALLVIAMCVPTDSVFLLLVNDQGVRKFVRRMTAYGSRDGRQTVVR